MPLVYSTNPDFNLPSGEERKVETLPPSKQKLTVYLDRRNRGGKTVTLVKGFIGSEEDLAELGRTLKSRCGTGGRQRQGRGDPDPGRLQGQGDNNPDRYGLWS